MRVDAAAEGDPADVSSVHAKAAGAGSDQAATLRCAGIRELTVRAGKPAGTSRPSKLRVGRWSPWMSSGKDFPSIAFPPGAPFVLGPETAPVDAARSTRNDGRGRVQ